MSNLLEVKNVEKYYGSKKNITKALAGVSFNIDENEFTGIMGSSGSGKTTLLNCIATIDTVSSGFIYMDKIDLSEIKEKDIARFRRENIGFIFQDFNLLDTLTISENISLSLIINNTDPNQVDSLVHEYAKKLGIEDILDKYPYEVSGGQKQRCACARALINHPKLILADEPTGALDSHSAGLLLDAMKTMNEQLGATILMVTHDAFSASYCKRILFLKDGKIFNELVKGDKSRRQFFEEILDVLASLGGDHMYVK